MQTFAWSLFSLWVCMKSKINKNINKYKSTNKQINQDAKWKSVTFIIIANLFLKPFQLHLGWLQFSVLNFQIGSKWLCLVTPSQKFVISEITPNRHHLTLCCSFKCSKLLLPLPLILSDSFLFIPVQQDISSVHLGHVFIPGYLCWSC